MRSEDLDRALGATPASFAEKMDQTLRGLKEEETVKRKVFRTAVVFALATALLCSTAYALVTQGLEWYYNNRLTSYKENEPDKYNAIMENLQTAVPQEAVNDPDISIRVAEISWMSERQTLVVAVEAETINPETVELHPMFNLDADGSYMGPDGPVEPDSEERLDHWLWTNTGFGPIPDMVAPGKQLVLVDFGDVQLDGIPLYGGMDVYRDESGVNHAVLECRLDFLDPGKEVAALRQEDVRLLREKMAAAEDGVLTLTLPYRVVAYTDQDDMALSTGGRKGELKFEVKLNEMVQKMSAASTQADTPITGEYATLREGDSGAAVEALQDRLQQLGYLADATGAYDSATTAAVRAFQEDSGLMADGVAGSMTQEKLFSGTAQPEL